MNIKQKFLPMALMVTTLVSGTIGIFAKEVSSIDNALELRGFPEYVIELMSEDTKKEVYKENTKFEGAVVEYYNEDKGEFSTLAFTPGEETYIPYGQIPTDHLSMVYTISSKWAGSYLDYMKVTFDYEWNDTPFNRYQDPIAISWDGDKFDLQADSFHKVDKYTYAKADAWGNVTYPTEIHSDEWGYAKATSDGVTWYADLKGHTVNVWDLFGYATFNLEPTSSTQSGSSTLYAHYAHAKTTGSLSIGIPGFGSFSVSGGASYDERGNQRDFSWTLD